MTYAPVNGLQLFDEFAAKNSALVHEFPGWADELRSLRLQPPGGAYAARPVRMVR